MSNIGTLILERKDHGRFQSNHQNPFPQLFAYQIGQTTLRLVKFVSYSSDCLLMWIETARNILANSLKILLKLFWVPLSSSSFMGGETVANLYSMILNYIKLKNLLFS